MSHTRRVHFAKALVLSLFVFGSAATSPGRAEIVAVTPAFVLATAAEDGEFATYRSVPTATTTPTGYAVAWIEETWAPGGVLISSGIGGKRLDVPAGLDFFLEAPATEFPFRAETPQLAPAPNGSVRAFWGQHQTVQSLRFFADGTGLDEQPIAIEPEVWKARLNSEAAREYLGDRQMGPILRAFDAAIRPEPVDPAHEFNEDLQPRDEFVRPRKRRR